MVFQGGGGGELGFSLCLDEILPVFVQYITSQMFTNSGEIAFIYCMLQRQGFFIGCYKKCKIIVDNTCIFNLAGTLHSNKCTFSKRG